MTLARAPMLFVTVAQEKRDFKIFVILITELSQVRILHGPPKKGRASVKFARLFSSFGSFSLVERLAHLAADGILPLVVDLRINCQCRAGLGVTRFGRHCSDTDVRVGEQDTDKGVAKHMRVDFADARFLGHAVNNFAIVVGADGPAEIIDNDKIFPAQLLQGFPVRFPLSVHAGLPSTAHTVLLCKPLVTVGFQIFHKFGCYIYVTDVVLFRGR